ncbi:MAG: hypothetical protein ONB44_00940 [candidate division KSB1 bacterium]|nr:hypothetical protein [candidate division KSB1 bacterium]MDZ7300685.1 hypothetical protein [candidate division KSB1 bacterium]MDZ7309821.1 hypothetical protein [candidate division KSB1 bacterium]
MSMLSKLEQEKQMADAILGYLAEHPRASDTLEGIAEWWIMRHQVRVEVNTLERILRQLTNSGLLEKTGLGDNPRYILKIKIDESHSE